MNRNNFFALVGIVASPLVFLSNALCEDERALQLSSVIKILFLLKVHYDSTLAAGKQCEAFCVTRREVQGGLSHSPPSPLKRAAMMLDMRSEIAQT